ncbi:hypothetical protein PR048_005488 [Dryococelus australis]|uniref:Uncharacterized protein n=1 Tax=Dryococelus australis TaxID=614101 RepID=A0ABQ9I8A8_9NEOP|nr:hypothetical protein PR048_005488 [Dryococelus australis]
MTYQVKRKAENLNDRAIVAVYYMQTVVQLPKGDVSQDTCRMREILLILKYGRLMKHMLKSGPIFTTEHLIYAIRSAKKTGAPFHVTEHC